MKYKPTKKFKELDSSSAYQGLEKDQYNKLESGKAVEIDSPPERLIIEKYIIGVKDGN